MLSVFWLVHAGEREAAVTQEEQAETLERSLQAVEWYTNESVRKALQAESGGDIANARLFGDKAIESDLKAKDLRSQTAAAWVQADKPERAQAAWLRAANMAQERAELLYNRVAPLQQQMLNVQPHEDVAVKAEREVVYLQAVFLALQQWVLAAGFFESADEKNRADDTWKVVARYLPILLKDNRLRVLAGDARLKGAAETVEKWKNAQTAQ